MDKQDRIFADKIRYLCEFLDPEHLALFYTEIYERVINTHKSPDTHIEIDNFLGEIGAGLHSFDIESNYWDDVDEQRAWEIVRECVKFNIPKVTPEVLESDVRKWTSEAIRAVTAFDDEISQTVGGRHD